MKKLAFVTLFVFIIGLSVNANDSKQMQIMGNVINTNDKNKSFAINDTKGNIHQFAITPTSTFKFQQNIYTDAGFSDMNTGSLISISYYSGKELHIANEIKIH